MIKYLKEYRFYITLFLFLLIPIIALDTSTRAPREYHFYDRVILTVTSPLQTAVTWSLEKAVDAYQDYVYLWHTRQTNEELFRENRALQKTIAGLRESQAENTRLRNLLDFQEKLKLTTVVARVIAKDVSTEFRALRINRGTAAGIQQGMAVITNEGIVGRVLRATSSTADVVTILDLLSAVDSIVERSRSRGVVEGMTDDTCQLKFVLRTDDIQVGDLLVSSGLGGIYPKGVPVGTVLKVAKKPFGISQDVEVKPSVDFTRLEEVMVVTQQKLEVLEKEAVLKEKAAEKAAEKPGDHHAKEKEKAKEKPKPKKPAAAEAGAE